VSAVTAAAVLPDPAPAPGTVGDVLDCLAGATVGQDLARAVARSLQALLHARVSVEDFVNRAGTAEWRSGWFTVRANVARFRSLLHYYEVLFTP
jgi:hypothetical protein